MVKLTLTLYRRVRVEDLNHSPYSTEETFLQFARKPGTSLSEVLKNTNDMFLN